jgi:hypothetical protein
MNSPLDEFSVMSDFCHPTALSPEHGIRYSKVAAVERGPGGVVVGYFSPFEGKTLAYKK